MRDQTTATPLTPQQIYEAMQMAHYEALLYQIWRYEIWQEIETKWRQSKGDP